MNEGCGEKSDVGGEIVVGVEGAFTGISINPSADPTGLMLLMAMIDNRYWPLHVCGDKGLGTAFNDVRNLGGNVSTYSEIIDTIDNPIEAFGCVLNCEYTITEGLYTECIVAKIDGAWQILRVLGTSNTLPITKSSNGCRCCGLTPQSSLLFARIMSVTPGACGDHRACDEFILRGRQGNLEWDGACDPDNPMQITVDCRSGSESGYNDPADWTIRVCNQEVEEIVSLSCCEPVTECINPIIHEGVDVETCECQYASDSDSQSISSSDNASISACGSPTSLCRLELTVRTGPLASCGGCDYTIFIYSDPYDLDPCTSRPDVVIDEVNAEACGIDDLSECDRVIIARVPFRYPVGITSSCPPVEWFIIRACSIKECEDQCDPPPPPGILCCGLPCEEQPLTLTATIELMDCGCAPCSFTVELTRQDCIATIYWVYDPGVTELKCDSGRTYVSFNKIEYFCSGNASNSASGSGSGSGSGSVSGSGSDAIDEYSVLILNGTDTTLIESSCFPRYSVFEAEGYSRCDDKTPGMLPPILDLTCRVRITITE
jgi:hypothetical protein